MCKPIPKESMVRKASHDDSTREVKVLHLRSSAGFYGAEQVIVTLLKQLANTEVGCTLALIDNYINKNRELAVRAEDEGIDVVEIPCRGKFDPRTLLKLTRYLRNKQIDIVHTHDYKSGFYGYLAARIAGRKIVSTLHGWILTSNNQKIYKYLETKLLKRFNGITVVSKEIREELIRRNLPPGRLKLIANGVDIEKYCPRNSSVASNQIKIPENMKVLGTVARMTPEKGHLQLIEAFARIHERYDNVVLLLVGDGQLRESIESKIACYDLQDRILIAGQIKEVELVYPMLDAYISPSLTEGMPMAVLEAMACALPVIATDVGEVGTIVNESEAGYVVPPNDIGRLADAIGLFLIQDEKRIAGMGSRARNYVENNYTDAKQAHEFARFYQSVVHGRQ